MTPRLTNDPAHNRDHGHDHDLSRSSGEAMRVPEERGDDSPLEMLATISGPTLHLPSFRTVHIEYRFELMCDSSARTGTRLARGYSKRAWRLLNNLDATRPW